MLSIVHVQTVEYKYALRTILQSGTSKISVTVREIIEHLLTIYHCFVHVILLECNDTARMNLTSTSGTIINSKCSF